MATVGFSFPTINARPSPIFQNFRTVGYSLLDIFGEWLIEWKIMNQYCIRIQAKYEIAAELNRLFSLEKLLQSMNRYGKQCFKLISVKSRMFPPAYLFFHSFRTKKPTMTIMTMAIITVTGTTISTKFPLLAIPKSKRCKYSIYQIITFQSIYLFLIG